MFYVGKFDPRVEEFDLISAFATKEEADAFLAVEDAKEPAAQFFVTDTKQTWEWACNQIFDYRMARLARDAAPLLKALSQKAT